MVEVAEIVDEESFQAWLRQEDLPREAMVALAHRAAMRVLPIAWMNFMYADWAIKANITAFPILRAALTAQVVSQYNQVPFAAEVIKKAYALGYWAANYAERHDDQTVMDASDAEDVAYVVADACEGKIAVIVQLTNDHLWGHGWSALAGDCSHVNNEKSIYSKPLWAMNDHPLVHQWDELRRRASFSIAPQDEFWIDWYQRALDGTEDRWDLLRDIALLDKDDTGEDLWQNPEKLAAEIARLEAAYNERKKTDQPVETQLAKLPPPSEATVAKVKAAMQHHRRDLPPTLDALLGYLALEIERLQNRNYRNAEDQEECDRQIRVLLTLVETVEKLKTLVPTSGDMAQEDAVEATKLGQLYVRKFKEWPRKNVDDVVDSGWRAALVGTTTVALPMIGVTQPYAFAAGLVLFGGKKMAEALKAAKDAIQ